MRNERKDKNEYKETNEAYEQNKIKDQSNNRQYSREKARESRDYEDKIKERRDYNGKEKENYRYFKKDNYKYDYYREREKYNDRNYKDRRYDRSRDYYKEKDDKHQNNDVNDKYNRRIKEKDCEDTHDFDNLKNKMLRFNNKISSNDNSNMLNKSTGKTLTRNAMNLDNNENTNYYSENKSSNNIETTDNNKESLLERISKIQNKVFKDGDIIENINNNISIVDENKISKDFKHPFLLSNNDNQIQDDIIIQEEDVEIAGNDNNENKTNDKTEIKNITMSSDNYRKLYEFLEQERNKEQNVKHNNYDNSSKINSTDNNENNNESPVSRKSSISDMFKIEDSDDERDNKDKDKNLILNLPCIDAFEDNEGYYIPKINEIINQKYKVISVIGKGVFSCVIGVININDPTQEYALKIIRNNDIMRLSGEKEKNILAKVNKGDKHSKCLYYYYYFLLLFSKI